MIDKRFEAIEEKNPVNLLYGTGLLFQTVIQASVGLASRIQFPQEVANFLGGHINRGIFEHSLEAATVLPFLVGIMMIGCTPYDWEHKKVVRTAITASLPLAAIYYGLHLMNEQHQAAEFHRQLQTEQLVATGAGLIVGYLGLEVVNKIADHFWNTKN